MTLDKIIDPALKKVPKIEVKDVKVWYSDFNAIKGISMDIKPNTVTAFIGPSGCGKSTFLNIIGLLDSEFEGKYDLLNKTDENMENQKIRKIDFATFKKMKNENKN